MSSNPQKLKKAIIYKENDFGFISEIKDLKFHYLDQVHLLTLAQPYPQPYLYPYFQPKRTDSGSSMSSTAQPYPPSYTFIYPQPSPSSDSETNISSSSNLYS